MPRDAKSLGEVTCFADDLVQVTLVHWFYLLRRCTFLFVQRGFAQLSCEILKLVRSSEAKKAAAMVQLQVCSKNALDF